MIIYKTSDSEKDLSGILKLQKENLPVNLNREEINSQGFVTVEHSYDQLKKMNDIEKHVIGKDRDNVIAYLLAMTKRSKSDIPVLVPMFETFDKVIYKNKPIAEYNYLVVGQVCVSKNYRGRGILDECYAAYKNHFKDKYDFAITEIDLANQRSLNAHKRIGFKEIHHYTTDDNKEWSIVLWDW